MVIITGESVSIWARPSLPGKNSVRLVTKKELKKMRGRKINLIAGVIRRK